MKYKLVILFLLYISSLFAQDVKFIAAAPKVVEVGEIFRLSFTVNDRGEAFIGPSLNDFEFQGPSSSSNFSTQIINGKAIQSASYSFNYTLRAKKEGKFTIQSAKVTVKGKQYESQELIIDVVKAKVQPNNRQQQAVEGNNQISDKDLYAKIITNKTSVYKGQHLLATIKIYTKLNLGRIGNQKFPSYNGFWSQELTTPQQVNLQRENVNGEIYNVGVIKKTLLFPQMTGEITIDPFEIDCGIRKQSRSRSIFDDFFGGTQTINKRIISPSVKIRIKDLPEGQPTSFNGAVGQFTIKSTIDKKEIKANEAITVKLTITGNGNLKLIDPVEYEFPPDFEIFEPKILNNYKATEAGLRGTKTFEYLVIPRHAGDYTIPSVEFSYFDPTSQTYKSNRTPSYDIVVAKGDSGAGDVVVSGFSKENVKYIGSDIRYIRTGDIKLKKAGNLLFGSFKFYLYYLIPFLVLMTGIILRKKAISKKSDTQLLKNRLANKVSRKRLKKAAVYLKEEKREEFCNEILKALWGYLSDKLGIPTSELSQDSVISELSIRQVDDETINLFKDVMDNCEYDRYAPVGESIQSDIIYKKAADSIAGFEQQLK